jgi:hypothetical protein
MAPAIYHATLESGATFTLCAGRDSAAVIYASKAGQLSKLERESGGRGKLIPVRLPRR